MRVRTFVLGFAAIAAGCAGARPAPEVPLDRAVQASPVAEPARPLQLVEIPQLLPLPGQLKPGPAAGSSSETGGGLSSADTDGSTPQQRVTEANAAARIEPSRTGFVNAIQVWPYSPGALYQVYTSPGKITDIGLEAGEELKDISAPDTVRWVIGDTVSGAGSDERVHIAVKPARAGLQSNLVLYTNRRTYYLELASTAETWMASVSWEYPHDRLLALKTVNREREALAPIAEGVALERLQFRYEITGDAPSWRPERAFDDGEKVYIEFPRGIAQGEMPPLFVIGPVGDAQLVNYRVHAPYYIVDRLFGAAELLLGGKTAQTVRITRTDVKQTKRTRSHAR
ncbi:MAG: P-type conjugative transfer protein TrbG [Gammaproteobacteria bacterium]